MISVWLRIRERCVQVSPSVSFSVYAHCVFKIESNARRDDNLGFNMSLTVVQANFDRKSMRESSVHFELIGNIDFVLEQG